MTTTIYKPLVNRVKEIRNIIFKFVRREIIGRIFLNLFLYIFAFIILTPFIWMILTAVKIPSDIVAIPFKWFPTQITFENFRVIFEAAPFHRYMLNSIIVSSINTATAVFIASIVGYGFAKFRFYGSSVLFGILLTGLMIPFSLRLLPLYRVIVGLGLHDTFIGLILPNITSILGIFLMRQYLMSFPSEIIESGRIDGASELRIFFSLVLPHTKPAIAAVGIFKFVFYWNDFLWPLVVLDSVSKRTITVGLSMWIGPEFLQQGPFMASTAFSIIPILVVCIILQKYIIKGVVLTGIKG